jgi:glycosyltransferase involved in cell wall biosynthesis
MKIVLAVEELNGIYGGVERTVVNLANYLRREGDDVTILTFERPDIGSPAYPLDTEVERVDLGLLSPQDSKSRLRGREELKKRLPGPVTAVIRNALALNRVVSVRRREIPLIVGALKSLAPDIVVSFKTHFHRYVVPAAVSAGIPVIASDHNPPEILYYHYVCSLDRRVIWHYLDQADAIRTLLDSYREGYPRKLRSKCVGIPNGIELPERVAEVTGREGVRTIINVGRLYFQKDQVTLIRAFAHIAPDFPDWGVRIYGDGPEENRLRSVIAECGLGERVKLMGPDSDIIPAYLSAQVFALPSIFEGFGNVTLEALACGLPVVAFDDCAANRELIQHEENGILVDLSDRTLSFAKGLERLMADAELRVRLGKNARESARRFELGAVMAQWKELIERKVKTVRT